MKKLILALILLPSIAFARPPAYGSEDYEIMYPFAGFIERSHDISGNLCCNLADGRPAPVRMKDGHWQAYIGSAQFERAPNAWITVPDAAFVEGKNPVGVAITWWFFSDVAKMTPYIRCFLPENGT